MGTTSRPAARPGPLTLLARGSCLRCPHCGAGGMFRSWFALQNRCRTCGLRFERDEQDEYWLGAYLLNFILTETVFALAVLITVVITWPSPPWRLLLWGGAILMVGTPIVLYPLSKALWLAADLACRPVKSTDFGGGDEPPSA